jgi:dipeptidyl-peptidase-4
LKRASVLRISALAALSLATLPFAAQDAQKALTVEAIYAHGSPAGSPPEDLRWSPDGGHLTYLDGGELMDVDPATAKPRVLVSRV